MLLIRSVLLSHAKPVSIFSGGLKYAIARQVSAVNAFSQTLRRYTSLNHLAQAARAVLHNSGQISQMLSDLNRVDFHNVQEQVFDSS